jgi:hypothetical protein
MVARCETSGQIRVNELRIGDALRMALANEYREIYLYVALISFRIFNPGYLLCAFPDVPHLATFSFAASAAIRDLEIRS